MLQSRAVLLKRPTVEAKLVYNPLSHLHGKDIKLSRKTLPFGLVKSWRSPEGGTRAGKK